MIKTNVKVDEIIKSEQQKKFEDLKQKKLKKKYKVKNENVYVVEKKTILDLLLKSVIGILKIMSVIILLITSSLGLISLVYTKPRTELFIVLTEIYNQTINSFLN